MASLEPLCRPLVRAICQYWYNARAGAHYDLDVVRRDLRDKLATIRENVEDDPVLKRNFLRIERPLVFFIDYTIKEGGFDFSNCWQELARDYDELSGDDKFFDMLSDTLDDPDASEQLMMYYLFMGLGFDGAQTDRDFIERRMKVCATRFNSLSVPIPKILAADSIMTQTRFKTRHTRKFWNLYTLMIALFLLMICAFIYNFLAFRSGTSEYRTALTQAHEKAVWTKVKKHDPGYFEQRDKESMKKADQKQDN